MPIITQADLATNIYAEIITEITRSDDSIAGLAIAAAISEAKMYLSRYDLPQLFGTDSTPSSVADEFLKALVKDLACWHIVRLSNTGVDHAAFRTAYQDAITTLRSIQAGQAQPEGWPYADAAATPPDGDTISWSSNPRRNNFY